MSKEYWVNVYLTGDRIIYGIEKFYSREDALNSLHISKRIYLIRVKVYA